MLVTEKVIAIVNKIYSVIGEIYWVIQSLYWPSLSMANLSVCVQRRWDVYKDQTIQPFNAGIIIRGIQVYIGR